MASLAAIVPGAGTAWLPETCLSWQAWVQKQVLGEGQGCLCPVQMQRWGGISANARKEGKDGGGREPAASPLPGHAVMTQGTSRRVKSDLGRSLLGWQTRSKLSTVQFRRSMIDVSVHVAGWHLPYEALSVFSERRKALCQFAGCEQRELSGTFYLGCANSLKRREVSALSARALF